MKKERSKKHRVFQLLRVFSQAAFFGLFLWLFFGTHYTGQDYIGNVQGMFHFDPLLALVTTIAARALAPAWLPALLVLALTAVFGRFFCGWV